MLRFDTIDDVSKSERTTLVVHPAIQRAIKGHGENFDVELRCFLAGETDGLYFLPFRAHSGSQIHR